MDIHVVFPTIIIIKTYVATSLIKKTFVRNSTFMKVLKNKYFSIEKYPCQLSIQFLLRNLKSCFALAAKINQITRQQTSLL